MNTRRLCIDATSLDMNASKRGIGFYVKTLLDGLGVGTQFWQNACTLRFWPAAELERDETITLPIGKLPERIFWLASAAMLGRTLQNRGVEIFHSTHPYHTPISRKFKTVATVYDLIPLIYYNDYLKSKRANAKLSYNYYLHQLKRADHLIAISDQTKNDCTKYLGIPPDRITSIHLAIDSNLFRPLSKDQGLAEIQTRHGLPKKFFLYVGGADFRKNLKTLVNAYGSIADQAEEDLVLVGSWNSQWVESMRTQLQKLRLASRVRFLSFVPSSELPALYNLATALVFPSLYEGFGLPVLESFSCGTPVLCSNTSSLYEIANGSALLVDPLNVQEIADGMNRLASDHRLCAQLKVSGMAKAREFSIKRMSQKTLEVYRTLGL
jgi:glycosyltransferase involved in cell wall biosynthesis